MRGWLPPPGYAVTSAVIDERPGGHYRVALENAAGSAVRCDSALIELVPDERIVLRWRFAGTAAEVAPVLHSRVTISLRRASGDATRLTLVHESIADAENPRMVPAQPARAPTYASSDDLGEIWRAYKASGDRALYDRLFMTYAPLVKYVASNIGSRLPPHVDQSDLVSYGLLGLAGAIHHFEPESGIGFESYAIPRIRGTILDELRSLDWLPRSVRDLAREIERAIAQLEQRLGHAPADAEIAGELGISMDEFEQRLTQIGRSSLIPLDELRAIATTDGENGEPSRREKRFEVAQAIARLADRERLVATLYYYEGLTLHEIGEVMGLTEARVSRLHADAILRLRAQGLFPRPLRAASPVAMPGLARDADRGWRQALNRLAARLAEGDDQSDWRS